MNSRTSLQKMVGMALLVLLAACAAPSPPPTPTPVPTATPSPTPTPIPLSEIDLEPILILPGDLPAGFSGAQIRDVLPEMFATLPDSDNQIYQQFERNGRAAGGVAVMLYESSDDIDGAYSLLLEGFGEPSNEAGITVERQAVPDVGEQAETVTIEGTLLGVTLDSVDLAFIRCSAVVHIRLVGTALLAEASSYARRLDERLAGLVCR